jgi:hypothetical protein
MTMPYCKKFIDVALPGTGPLRFIEAKGRVKGTETLTISKNEVLTGLNKPDELPARLRVGPATEDQDATAAVLSG